MQTVRESRAVAERGDAASRVSVVCAGCHVQATAEVIGVLRGMGWQFRDVGAVCPRCAKGLPNPFAAA
jgi:hypothetical protein